MSKLSFDGQEEGDLGSGEERAPSRQRKKKEKVQRCRSQRTGGGETSATVVKEPTGIRHWKKSDEVREEKMRLEGLREAEKKMRRGRREKKTKRRRLSLPAGLS